MNSTIYSYFDSPENYEKKHDFYDAGSSPELLKKLGWYIKRRETELDSIYLSFYLYNNLRLHNYFKKLANAGVKINVVSIPLDGYDNSNPKPIKSSTDKNNPAFNQPKTKHDLAAELYNDIKTNTSDNYQLYIFPHMFIRSARLKPFSRGKMPYSLHIKNGWIKFKNNKSTAFLTSSNFAIRDLVKEENLIIVENHNELNRQLSTYFKHLIHNSINSKEFNPSSDYFKYKLSECKAHQFDDGIVTAAFYKDSPLLAEKKIKDLVNGATERIYISAQHISCYHYSVPKKFKYGPGKSGYENHNGFLADVLKKAQQNTEVKILSQTFVDEQGKSHNCRQPANKNSFTEFIKACARIPSVRIFANEDVHSKFIIVDDKLIITTFNYTPTQFIYLPFVEIPEFNEIEGIQYKGIFAEVGQLFIVRDSKVVQSYVNKFNELCRNKKTYQHK